MQNNNYQQELCSKYKHLQDMYRMTLFKAAEEIGEKRKNLYDELSEIRQQLAEIEKVGKDYQKIYGKNAR